MWPFQVEDRGHLAQEVCKRVTYQGRVQGVGFRYTAQRLAGGFPVAGYVRNLPSGDVELVVEGESGEVEAFLAALGQRMVYYIDGATVTEETPAGWQGFHIRL